MDAHSLSQTGELLHKRRILTFLFFFFQKRIIHDVKISLRLLNPEVGKKMFLLHRKGKKYLHIFGRRIENGKEPPDDAFVNLLYRGGTAAKRRQSLTGWNNGIMIGDCLIIYIACLFNPLIRSVLQDRPSKERRLRVVLQPGNVAHDFFCHCTGEYPCICSGIGGQLFFI